jgi:hypothetical protein
MTATHQEKAGERKRKEKGIYSKQRGLEKTSGCTQTAYPKSKFLLAPPAH